MREHGYTANTGGSATVWKGEAGSERDYRDTLQNLKTQKIITNTPKGKDSTFDGN